MAVLCPRRVAKVLYRDRLSGPGQWQPRLSPIKPASDVTITRKSAHAHFRGAGRVNNRMLDAALAKDREGRVYSTSRMFPHPPLVLVSIGGRLRIRP